MQSYYIKHSNNSDNASITNVHHRSDFELTKTHHTSPWKMSYVASIVVVLFWKLNLLQQDNFASLSHSIYIS